MIVCDSYDKYAKYGYASKGIMLYIQNLNLLELTPKSWDGVNRGQPTCALTILVYTFT